MLWCGLIIVHISEYNNILLRLGQVLKRNGEQIWSLIEQKTASVVVCLSAVCIGNTYAMHFYEYHQLYNHTHLHSRSFLCFNGTCNVNEYRYLFIYVHSSVVTVSKTDTET